jgi:hypothetical protein
MRVPTGREGGLRRHGRAPVATGGAPPTRAVATALGFVAAIAWRHGQLRRTADVTANHRKRCLWEHRGPALLYLHHSPPEERAISSRRDPSHRSRLRRTSAREPHRWRVTSFATYSNLVSRAGAHGGAGARIDRGRRSPGPRVHRLSWTCSKGCSVPHSTLLPSSTQTHASGAGLALLRGPGVHDMCCLKTVRACDIR